MVLQNKNAFVTGGAGFIGSTLVRELLKEKANVIVFDNFLSGKMKNLEEVKDKIEIIEGDIRDKKLKDVMIKNKVDFVFNLAAEPYIPHCYDRPENFFEINSNGAMNVMLSAKAAGVTRAIQYSSSEIYGTARQVPMDEFHPTIPFSTYAVSKLAADRLCFTLYHEQQIPIVILRQFNVYGPRETHPYVIPEIITQLNKGNKLKLGNVAARRDFTYVTDAAKGAIALMKCKKAEGEVVNMGYGQDWSIEEIAHIIGELMGHDKIEITTEKARFRPLDVQQLQCNYFKMHKLTGWDPIVGFKEGLQKTIDDFKNNNCKWLWEDTFGKEDDIWHGKCKK
ncbi:SDR family NAD(P)-dependent oxidoreductase [candidate division KSB1 bacterium]